MHLLVHRATGLGVRRFTTMPLFSSTRIPLQPTYDKRTSPEGDTLDDFKHPGYVPHNTEPESTNFEEMHGVDHQAIPSSTVPMASTKPVPPHPSIHDMAQGAKWGGADGETPEERSTKTWGPNQRSPEFNPKEGQRNPVLDSNKPQKT